MDYFSLFFNDELLYNIVIETDRYGRHKISELQLGPRSIWNSWSDVSVPEMKAYLGLIINTRLMLVPDIRDHWSSECITNKMFWRCNVYSSLFADMMHVGNDTTEENNRAIKRTKKVHGVIEYTEKQFEIYTLCPCCTNFSSKTVHLVALRIFKIP
jgi:hypothetical protein